VTLAKKQTKTAMITGANKGLGFETAKQLGVKGYTVIIGTRNRVKGEEAAEQLTEHGINAHFLQVDVTDTVSIEAAARKIEQQFGKLDVLINNAGVFLDQAPPSRLDITLLRETFETNFFGVFAVTQAMLPLIRKSSAGRIVNMSSSLGSLTLNRDPDFELANFKMVAYNTSKTALNAMTIQFAYELRDTSIKINSADPGYTATDMTGHRGPRNVSLGAAVVVRLAELPDDGPTGGFFDELGEVPW
jgi:NAD(P)-dependent dehydrogenase (short-subunit alcohol dehydrogenase family)